MDEAVNCYRRQSTAASLPRPNNNLGKIWRQGKLKGRQLLPRGSPLPTKLRYRLNNWGVTL